MYQEFQYRGLCNEDQALQFSSIFRIFDTRLRSFVEQFYRDIKRNNSKCKEPKFSYSHNTLPSNPCTYHRRGFLLQHDLQQGGKYAWVYPSKTCFNPWAYKIQYNINAVVWWNSKYMFLTIFYFIHFWWSCTPSIKFTYFADFLSSLYIY